MSKFTKGEWRVNDFGNISYKAGHQQVFQAGATDDDIRLMAVVPEMYEMLDDCFVSLKARKI